MIIRKTLYEMIESFPAYIEGKFRSMKRGDCIYFEITSCKKGKQLSDKLYEYNIEINFKDTDDDMDYQYLFFDTKEALKFAEDHKWSSKKLRIEHCYLEDL